MKWLAAAIVASAFLFLFLDGYQIGINVGIRGSTNFDGEPPFINWAHGWPCHFMVRSSIYSEAAGKGSPTPRSIAGNDTGFYSRWPFDESPTAVFRMVPLLIDFALFMLLVAGTWLGVGELAQRLGLRARFSLKFMFALVTLIAVIIAFEVPAMLSRQELEVTAMAVNGLGILAALAGSLSGLIRILHRPRLRMAVAEETVAAGTTTAMWPTA